MILAAAEQWVFRLPWFMCNYRKGSSCPGAAGSGACSTTFGPIADTSLPPIKEKREELFHLI